MRAFIAGSDQKSGFGPREKEQAPQRLQGKRVHHSALSFRNFSASSRDVKAMNLSLFQKS